MRESDNGQYVETLGNQPDHLIFNSLAARGAEPQERPPLYKVGDARPPTLNEVMLDPEFLQELKGGNQLLFEYLDVEKLLQLADYVICEPKFSDSAERCF